jgi:polysaccharide export outer membrane protein
MKAAATEAERNYVIQEDDYLNVEVYTNKGERIIDPNFELLEQQGGNMQSRGRPNPSYLVNAGGYVKLPIIDTVKLQGLTLLQADRYLEGLYDVYYIDAFVITRYINKRVIILGATGGQVIPLTNENMSLLEVLALAGGLSNMAKGNNIRLIRGDLDDPMVQIIDLTTIDGMRRAELNMLPGDIIYVEPVRRVFIESFRDVAPVISLLASFVTLFYVIQNQ